MARLPLESKNVIALFVRVAGNKLSNIVLLAFSTESQEASPLAGDPSEMCGEKVVLMIYPLRYICR